MHLSSTLRLKVVPNNSRNKSNFYTTPQPTHITNKKNTSQLQNSSTKASVSSQTITWPITTWPMSTRVWENFSRLSQPTKNPYKSTHPTHIPITTSETFITMKEITKTPSNVTKKQSNIDPTMSSPWLILEFAT